jgi:hypothetical protein
MTLPPVSPLINASFNVARAKYRDAHVAWTDLSFRLSGRFNLPIASLNIQRQGDIDLLLRCMEDEFSSNAAGEKADTTGVDMTFHYQMTLSEIWIVGCYEILRAFRQRDSDARGAGMPTSGVSELNSFKSIFADLELLRMPLAKFEIAKDNKLKKPLLMQRVPHSDDASDHAFYDSKDPARYHLMPRGMSPRGAVSWVALDHLVNSERWIERRDLSERLLALSNEIVPAGIWEAQQRAAET